MGESMVCVFLFHMHTQGLLLFRIVVFFSVYPHITSFKCHRYISRWNNMQKLIKQVHVHPVNVMNFDLILVHPLHFQVQN